MDRLTSARFDSPRTISVAVTATLVFAALQWPYEAAPSAQTPTPVSVARPCRVQGAVTSGTTPLPGTSIMAKVDGRIVAVTSSDVDGGYALMLAPGTYSLHVELTAFAPIDRDLTVGPVPCQTTTVDVAMPLASRVAGAELPPPPQPPAAPSPGGRGAFANGRGGAGGRFGGAGQRFQALTVTESNDDGSGGADVVADVSTANRADDPAARLLPPGFSVDALVESVPVSGSMVELDRAQMNDRLQALGRGEFGLGEGEQPGAAGFGGAAGGIAGAGGQGAGGFGGRGGGPGGGGPGGPGGLGGRVGGANRVQVSATYSMGGSAFDAAPYSLRGEPPAARDYLQQNFSTTIGGPLVIPHLYNGAQRTTFNLSYTGGRTGDLFDQYATVPSEAFRAGDFSSSATPIIDPATSQPFPGNQIPRNRMDPAALALLNYVPQSTLSGDTRNYRRVATSQSTTASAEKRWAPPSSSPNTSPARWKPLICRRPSERTRVVRTAPETTL